MSEDLLALCRQTGALLDGHFVLRSGLHSRQYFQCALLFERTDITAKVCGRLADKLNDFDCDTVISPALGGIIVGQEVGRSLGKRYIFVEKEEGKLVLRRGFQISPDEKFIVVEDVVTRGGRVQETIDIARPWRHCLRRRRDCRSKRRNQTNLWLPIRELDRNECGDLSGRQTATQFGCNSRR
jgi:orotate phosphoribosyltransferase